ncbi:Nucleotidyltransferase domain protein [Candidatus Tiddalikarchaeum anstoanum]|nr:Nucleotidyltransferase domain protein [Candidatus Tiddalikarchaeum anstoanum]
MLTQKQLILLSVFVPNLFKEYSFSELKRALAEKSNSVLQNALKQFKSENLVVERSMGTSKLYKINLDNNLVFDYIGIINKGKLSKQVERTISLIKEEVDKYTFFYSVVIFGSWAVGEERKDSDLDIAVFIEKDEDKKKVESALNSAEQKSLIKLDSHVISQDEFLEMLRLDEENLGKEIARKHLVVHNSKLFYSVLIKGVKNGFKL